MKVQRIKQLTGDAGIAGLLGRAPESGDRLIKFSRLSQELRQL
jgi:hypothetical protein